MLDPGGEVRRPSAGGDPDPVAARDKLVDDRLSDCAVSEYRDLLVHRLSPLLYETDTDHRLHRKLPKIVDLLYGKA
jgi:hypothetical protein